MTKLPGRRWASLALCALTALSMAGCAAQTVVTPEAQSGPYRVSMKLDPQTLNPPQTGTLTFSITDAQRGKPVTQLQQVSGALLHSVLISRDLTVFRHSYTQQLVDLQASTYVYFPMFSRYYAYAIYQPAGADPQLFRATITTIGQEGRDPQLTPEASPHKTAGWLTFDLLGAQQGVKAGQPAQFGFFVSERGRPVSALDSYLGAPAHLWIVDDKGESFAHLEGAAASTSYAAPSATPPPLANPSGAQNATPGATQTAGTASGVAGETGGTGASGQGAGGTASGLPGTPLAASTPMPSPTLAAGVAQALSTVQALPTQQLVSVQQTAQASILGTPLVVPSVGYGPVLAFTHTFPHAGLYKMWLEVLYRGEVVLVDYVVQAN